MSRAGTGPATLVLVRHSAHADPSRCANARHDPPLAPEGRAQAGRRCRAPRRLGRRHPRPVCAGGHPRRAGPTVGHALGLDDAATFALEIAHGFAAVVRRHPGGWTLARLGV